MRASTAYLGRPPPLSPKAKLAPRQSVEVRQSGEKSGLADTAVMEAVRRAVAEFETRTLTPERLPTADLGAAFRDVGGVPGEPVSETNARELLRRIAVSAHDLFPDEARAYRFLETTEMTPDGQKALELLETGRGVSVLARLDQLRFGFQG